MTEGLINPFPVGDADTNPYIDPKNPWHLFEVVAGKPVESMARDTDGRITSVTFSDPGHSLATREQIDTVTAMLNQL